MAKIFLGIGHGGKDSGAYAFGRKESNLNLVIGQACHNELIKHNVQVLMSRTRDEDDTLQQEIIECNAYNPDFAIDIHNNAGCGDGFEAFYSVTKSPKGTKSRELAAKIETEVKRIGQNSRGLKTKTQSDGRDWFGFVRECKCPAILIECAFVDSKDVEIIDTADKQMRMGQAIARGILATLGIVLTKPPTPSNPPPDVLPPTVFKYHVLATKNEQVTSAFGLRIDPINGQQSQHNGVDFVDAKNLQKSTPVKVLAFADGKVIFAGFSAETGNYIDILHASNTLTRYFHLSKTLVVTGQIVKQGCEIGVMGTTGRSTGIHLHFAIKEGSQSYNTGVYVDPMPYLKGVKTIITTPPAPIQPLGKTYTVKSGDSWWRIAASQMNSGAKYEQLAAYNGTTSKSVIRAGQTIKIP